jgi:hypothetical protein
MFGGKEVQLGDEEVLMIVLFNGERNENLLDGRFPVATSYAGWLNKNSQCSPRHISEQWFCHCGTK